MYTMVENLDIFLSKMLQNQNYRKQFVPKLPKNVSQKILSHASPEKKRKTHKLLSYKLQICGGLDVYNIQIDSAVQS